MNNRSSPFLVERRALLRGVALTALGALPSVRAAYAASLSPRPNWRRLGKSLEGALIKVESPLEVCAKAGGVGADSLFARLKNPYLLGDEPGLTQTLGWVDAWTSRASDYAVAAKTAADVAKAVDFARHSGVPLAIKGGGHSYFGNSNRAGSLLIWTRAMRSITLHDDFVAAGSPANAAPVPAVSVGAGCIWGEVYRAVCAEGGRYVQGGGCLTVGVAGFVQGGGFGSLSKQFGTGAANLLEAEIVTADGRVRIANDVQHPDLFFALKGGGGGTFGVVTRLTLRTHDLPSTIGAVLFDVQAASDSAWQHLVSRFVQHYADRLSNPNWGEIIRFEPNRRLAISMMFHGLTESQARAAWHPFLEWIAARPGDFHLSAPPRFLAIMGNRFWDPDYLRTVPDAVLQDDRPGTPTSNVFWKANLGEAGQVLNANESAWLPQALLDPARQAALVEALIAGSSQWPIALHVNKGLAVGSPDALSRTRATSTNPHVLDAFALLICAADAPPAWPGIPGHEPNADVGRREAAAVRRAMVPFEKLAPGAGAYVSEANYFEANWRSRYWGPHYQRLLETKRQYDPASLFNGHQTVGAT